VSLKTSVSGNVKYQKEVLEPAHIEETGEQKARWETTRLIADPVEHENAIKVRSKARSLITAVCKTSSFGLLCPEQDGEELKKAIAAANEVASNFNEVAALTRVSVYVLVGKVAPDDVEAVKAINSEIKDLLSDMERGLKNLDVKLIRDAAQKAKGLGEMLSPDAKARVQMAVEAARVAARKVVAAGEQAAAEIDYRAIRAVTEARTAFLDFDEAAPVKAPEIEQRALDLEPVEA
jgi:hypothetical protein